MAVYYLTGLRSHDLSEILVAVYYLAGLRHMFLGEPCGCLLFTRVEIHGCMSLRRSHISELSFKSRLLCCFANE